MGNRDEIIPTRRSLLSRLKRLDDDDTWKIFFDTYWRLIYHTAIKAGLTDAEAQDVVQETIMAVFKSMPRFEYRSQHASFKSWLLRLTSWRIGDQLRKREPRFPSGRYESPTSTKTGTVETIPDPASLDW